MNELNINVTITKTSGGEKEYIQIMSEDNVTINIVLVVDKINIQDLRPKAKAIKIKQG